MPLQSYSFSIQGSDLSRAACIKTVSIGFGQDALTCLLIFLSYPLMLMQVIAPIPEAESPQSAQEAAVAAEPSPSVA